MSTPSDTLTGPARARYFRACTAIVCALDGIWRIPEPILKGKEWGDDMTDLVIAALINGGVARWIDHRGIRELGCPPFGTVERQVLRAVAKTCGARDGRQAQRIARDSGLVYSRPDLEGVES